MMKLKNNQSFHRKILIVFADNIGLINYYKCKSIQYEHILCFSKIEGR